MSLAPGVRLGAYEILGLIGAGGMGEVYKARDTRLDRTVALKVLSAQGATDPDRRARFEREARAVAALNHPHICNLHDVGEAPSTDELPQPIGFLVMEYLEGQTLEERLVRGPLPPADVLRYAVELADALDHAHRRGLVHRDLKPGNVMLTKAGAKLLDFGISRLQAPADVSALSTVTTGGAPLTAAGTVIGTYPYMAPEQLAGRDADARTDIFAFGAVLFEMVTGRRAFEGTTAATVIGAILHTDPPALSAIQPLAPFGLDRIVARCLAKDPDNRWQSARDLMLELNWIAEHLAPVVAARETSRRTRLTWMAAALAVLAIAAATVTRAYIRRAPAEKPAIQLAFAPPKGVTLADPRTGGPVTVSPDGRYLAFVAMGSDARQLLWVRSIESTNAQSLSGTEGAAHPFWSPDSRFIGFFAQRKLKKIAATGGPPQVLCDAVQPRGGTWGRGGVIVFAAGIGYELYRLQAENGVATPVPADGKNQERAWPFFLPDGRHFVYFGRPQKHGIYLAELDSTETRLLLSDYVGVAYSAPGYLLVARGSSKGAQAASILALPFDSARFEVLGEPQVLADSVTYAPGLGRAAFSVSETGTLVYANIERPSTQLVWFDRTGTAVGNLGSGSFYAPSLSPDEKTVVAARLDPETQTPDLWLIDTARSVSPRFTFDPREDLFAVWSPGGERIVFAAQSAGTPPNLFQKAVNTTSGEEQLAKSRFNSQPTDWSRDGRFVVYARRDPQTQWDLWLMPMSPGADRTEQPYLRSNANEHLAQFSPDGMWMAYASDESGTNEVYVQTFPKLGTREQISTSGGSQPRWSVDGRELFYIAPDGRLMAVSVKPGATFEATAPKTLFKTRIADLFGSENNGYISNYTVSRDAKRFLISTISDESSAVPATTIFINWLSRLTGR